MVPHIEFTEEQVESQISEFINMLTLPSVPDEQLITFLNLGESCLSKVPQKPPKKLQDAISVLTNRLFADTFFSHQNIDVRVGVASWFTQLIRIHAPEPPLDDETTKKVLSLIVSTFENLLDVSSRSYLKRTSILITIANVKACKMMLDFKMYSLIAAMFRHFVMTISDYNCSIIFLPMAKIMTDIFKDFDLSDDIFLVLSSPLLDTLKHESEENLPARKLVEVVIQLCENTIKSGLIRVKKYLDTSFDNYGLVVASLCKEI